MLYHCKENMKLKFAGPKDLWQGKRGGHRKSEWIIWKGMIRKEGEKIN